MKCRQTTNLHQLKSYSLLLCLYIYIQSNESYILALKVAPGLRNQAIPKKSLRVYTYIHLYTVKEDIAVFLCVCVCVSYINHFTTIGSFITMTVFYARLGLIAIIPMRYMHEKPLLLKDLLRGVIPSDIAVRYRKEREKKKHGQRSPFIEWPADQKRFPSNVYNTSPFLSQFSKEGWPVFLPRTVYAPPPPPRIT